ncbi:hypothetical protein ACSQ67_006337 [Phaseolus vulgaris]
MEKRGKEVIGNEVGKDAIGNDLELVSSRGKFVSSFTKEEVRSAGRIKGGDNEHLPLGESMWRVGLYKVPCGTEAHVDTNARCASVSEKFLEGVCAMGFDGVQSSTPKSPRVERPLKHSFMGDSKGGACSLSRVGDEMILYLCVKHKVSVLARWLVGAVEMMPKITGLRFKEKRGALQFSVDVRLGIKVLRFREGVGSRVAPRMFGKIKLGSANNKAQGKRKSFCALAFPPKSFYSNHQRLSDTVHSDFGHRGFELFFLPAEQWRGMGDKDEESGMPRDAKIVKSLLKSMGVEGYEPRVIHKFLELWYRYVVDVLTDAQVYSEHAGKSAIDCDDVKLAIQSKVNFSFSQPPPRELQGESKSTTFTFWGTVDNPMIRLPYMPLYLVSLPGIMYGGLDYKKEQSADLIHCLQIKTCTGSMNRVLLELAQNRNKIPLPKTISGPGIPLPPDQDTLINPNYQFGIRNKRPVEPLEETEDEETTIPNPTQEEKVEMQQNPHQRVSFPLPKRQKD